MSTKRKENNPAPQQQTNPQLSQLYDTMNQYYQSTMPGAQRLQNLQTGYYENILPQAQQIYGQQADILGRLLSGQTLPGQLGQLGQGYGEGVEAEMFARNRERALTSLASSGLLDSGTRAELESQAATDIAIQNATQQRAELAQLLGLGLGTAGSAIGQGTSGISGAISQPLQVASQLHSGLQTRESLANEIAQNQFLTQLELQEQERANRASLWGGIGGGVGSVAGSFLGGEKPWWIS